MSLEAQELDRRLRAAADLKGVVRTLKSLAASTLKPLQDAAIAAEAYTKVLRLGAAACLRASDGLGQARPIPNPSGADVILAIGSDMGMVGAFNESVAKGLKPMAIPGSEIWTAGERLRQILEDSGLRPGSGRGLPDDLDAVGTWVDGVVVNLEGLREKHGLRSLKILRNAGRPGSGITLIEEELLPLERHWSEASLPTWPSRRIPQPVPAREPLLSDLAREELFTAIFLACVGSMACEALSRLEAMERAERNLDELQERLAAERNRARQESISQELLDLGTAYEAVRGRPADHANGSESGPEAHPR